MYESSMVILAESFWQNVYKVLTTPSLQLFLLLGSLILAISLLLLTMTRLGHARPITKCVVLSVIAHILLLGYAYGTKLISHVPLAKKEEPVQINLVDDIDEEEPELPLPTSEDLVDKFDHSILPDEHVSLQRPEPTVPFEMERIVDAFFSNTYTGKTKMMFFRSQITALLSHFFGQLAIQQTEVSKSSYKEQLNRAKNILLENIDNPPSLSELSKEIGFNTTRLKKEFKAFFGVPVFKYLQNERLTSAHKLIREKEVTVQEAAWQVGYDSLSSFSNAFAKKFGYRPSQIK